MMEGKRFPVLISLLFLQLNIFNVLGNSNSTCDRRENPAFFLDVAIDMIGKAKIYLPECPSVSQNSRLRPMDCEEVLRRGYNKSGVYTVWPRNRILEDRPIEVFCDMDTDGGGWTVIQRRGNFSRPKDYFFKDWSSYKIGFGDIEKDFWLGNDKIYALTNQRLSSIRFDLKAVDGEKRYALYDDFWIEDEKEKYRLRIDGYSGDAGDSMTELQKNQKFTTKDQDNDNHKDNCAVLYKGAWWYGACHVSNLNGLYHRGTHNRTKDGVSWYTFKGQHESMDTTEMKIRPKFFRKKLVSTDTSL